MVNESERSDIKLICTLCDEPGRRKELVKTLEGDYLIRDWQAPIGCSVGVVREVKLYRHEALTMILAMLEELEVWRKTDSATLDTV